MSVESLAYIDRLERKYQVGIDQNDLPAFWRDVGRYAPLYEFTPGQQVTWVSSVYFENKEFDLLRLGFLSIHGGIHVRLRTYEYECHPSRPILNYWLEMKTRKDQARKKRRLKMQREALAAFLEGKDIGGRILEDDLDSADPEMARRFYQEIRETILKLDLKPTLLVTYKRVAFQNETERLSIDWDMRFYHIGLHIHRYPSLKDIATTLGEKVDTVVLELKYPQGAFPAWVENLKRSYPIWERRYYSKFKDGMHCLFPQIFKRYAESNCFLQMIRAHTENWGVPLERYG